MEHLREPKTIYQTNYENGECKHMKNLTIVGRITKDAELNIRKAGETEIPVTNFNVAVNTRKATAERDAQGKRVYKTVTDYFRVTLWRDHAKSMVPYLQKGRLVSITGDFELETWMDRQNQVHPIAHFTSPAIELLDANKKADEEPAETTAAVEIDPEELPFE